MGAAVRDHRRAAGLSQQELARLAGVGKTVVFDIERGKPTVRLATLLLVLDALNLRLEWRSPLAEPPDA
jgi:y4mF family transcriptional regulator